MSARAMGEEVREFAIECARRLEVEIDDLVRADEVHPATRARVEELLMDMRHAACADAAAEVHRLAELCRWKDRAGRRVAPRGRGEDRGEVRGEYVRSSPVTRHCCR